MDKKEFITKIIKRLEVEKETIETRLKTRKEDIGSEDGPTQSRYISLSRFALEEELVLMIKLIKRLEEEIRALKRIKKTDNYFIVTIIIRGKEKQLLLTKEIEDFSNDIISETHPIGQKLKINPTKKLVIGKDK